MTIPWLDLAHALLGAATLLVAIPIAVLLLEVLASLGGSRRKSARATSTHPTTAVLVPAHDEEGGIGRTLVSLVPALAADDRVLVVADNCTDTTAEVARRLGAEVVERIDPERRGKGFALQFGVDHLAANGRRPEVLVVVDADCVINAEGIAALARTVARTGRPVQSLNLAEEQPHAGPLQAVSSLSFRFKNLVRTLGASRLGWPCHLMGTGMALPWSIAERVSFGGDNLTEDMQLGVDLALEGRGAVFEPAAVVTSPLPSKDAAFVSQRTRWESGHVRTSLKNVPRLLWGGLRHGRCETLGLAADLCVPPLSLLVMSWLLVTSTAGLGAWLGLPSWPFAVALAAGGTLGVAILLGWFAHCRESVPGRTFALVPWFVLRKLPIYAAMPFRRTGWVRTERDPSKQPSTSPPAVPSPQGERVRVRGA